LFIKAWSNRNPAEPVATAIQLRPLEVFMFKRILIPIDGSPVSEHAARLALHFAHQLGADALVVYVMYTPAEDGVPAQTPYGKHSQELLEPWPGIGRELGVKLETKLIQGEGLVVADAIIRTAINQSCDLIAMGTQGREGLERLLLGSVAERVVRRSSVPVLLVRQSVGEVLPSDGFQHILVPVDGSAASNKAIWTANEIAVRLNAELDFLHVVPDIPMMSDPSGLSPAVYNYEEWARALQLEGERVIANAKAAATAPKVRAASVLASGQRIAQVITEAARTRQADLIVMGTHGRGGFDRLLLGSVAEGVAHHASVPVMLVRSADENKPKS
jgi:nucleotide-binding universal stress UspA family protein